MAKNKTAYVCSKCGYETSKWIGRCPHCGEWNTMEEKVTIPVTATSSVAAITNAGTAISGRRLRDVSSDKEDRILTGIAEFDRAFGGGVVADSFNILSAPPGCGKSTLAIMVADRMIKNGLNVLYASGEESASQIKNRARRLKLKYIDDMFICDISNMDFVISEIEKYEIDFIVLDSLQTFFLNDSLPAKQGNPTQMSAVVTALKDLCKQSSKKRSVLAISQMNKDDQIAGKQDVVHIADACFYLEGDSSEPLRMLRATKNRFGDVEETGFFYMKEDGLQEVNDIANYFITKRSYDVVGVALTGVREANRYAMCEIESLTPQSYTAFPTRIGSSLRKEDLNILVSILEQRTNMTMGDKNVIIKTSGNIKLRESSTNLAVLMSIVSSYYNKPIPGDVLFFADVSLTGELKKCPNIESFANEANRLGYSILYAAKGCGVSKKFKNLKIIECQTLVEAVKKVFE